MAQPSAALFVGVRLIVGWVVQVPPVVVAGEGGNVVYDPGVTTVSAPPRMPPVTVPETVAAVPTPPTMVNVSVPGTQTVPPVATAAAATVELTLGLSSS